MTQTEDTKLIRLGITVSIAVHVTLALLATWYVSRAPIATKKEVPKPTPKVRVVFAKEVKVPPVTPVTPAPTQPAERYVRTTQNTPESTAPSNSSRISDRNTVASTTLPSRVDGETGLPTTRGVKHLSTEEMLNRDVALGESLESAPPKESSPPPTPAPRQEPPAETRQQRPNSAASIQRKPEVAETQPEPRKARPVLDPPVLRDPTSDKEAFQPQTRTSERAGKTQNPGLQNSVDARTTPKGKYMRLVTSQIEKRWHFLRTKRGDFVQPSKLRLRFYVGRDGKIRPQDIFIVSNNANPVLTDFSIQAIMEAQIPAMPEELLSQLDQERLEIEYDIVIY